MNVIGKSYPIHDAVGKSAGSAVYAGDIQLKGMLFAGLILSTIPHGYVKDIDFSDAERMPGVAGWLSCLSNSGAPFCRYRNIKGQNTPDQEYVWNRHVRFAGDRIGCILATSRDEARKAVQKVKVFYEEYPAALTVEQSLHGCGEGIHVEGSVSEEILVEVGKMPVGEWTEVTTHSSLARINHMAMEPHVCTADYNRHTGMLTIWSPSQSVHGLRTVIGDIFGLPYHKVRVIKTTMGGSFGGKQEWIAEPAAAAAALYIQGPVQLTLSREEVFKTTINRAPMELRARSYFDGKGHLISFQLDNTLDAGAYMGNSKDYCGAMANKFFRCYKYPHMKYTGRAVITNTPVSGAFRGWTSPELAICLEHNLNMAARRLGVDPLELRLINAAEPGDMDIRLRESLGPIRLKECIELGRIRFGWDKKREEDRLFNRESRRYRRGTAIACGGHLNGYYPRVNDFCGVEMRMTETGNVLVNASLHDHGCGTVQAFRMIVAEVLSLSPDMVQIGEGDTAITPFDYGCYSSRSTYVIGKAAMDCANLIAERLKRAVFRLEGVPEEQLLIENGAVQWKEGKKSWLFSSVVQESHSRLQEEIFAAKQYVNTSNPGVTGAHFAHVEVDLGTGDVEILDYLAVHDIGKAINPEMCRAQVQGAVAMGAGAALKEEVTVGADGSVLGSLRKYHLLNMPELPEIRVEFIEDGGTEGPFGCKSIGEVCHVPPTAAIIGAVNEALQSDLCQIPLNQDRICAWLEERSKEKL